MTFQQSVFAALLTLVIWPPLHAAGELNTPLTPAQEEPPLSEPEVAPRGRHAPRDITYSPWRKLCFKSPGKEAVCRTSITGSWDTGQMAIRVDVIERQGNGRLQILLPVGLYLQPGVKLKVDTSAREIVVPYNWCFSNLCIAGARASRELIRALEGSRTLSVEVVDTNLLSLTVTISADQFSIAHRGAPLETFEHVIDEE